MSARENSVVVAWMSELELLNFVAWRATTGNEREGEEKAQRGEYAQGEFGYGPNG